MTVEFRSDGVTADVLTSDGKVVETYKRYHGLYFRAGIPPDVVLALSNAYVSGQRVRLHYGYTDTMAARYYKLANLESDAPLPVVADRLIELGHEDEARNCLKCDVGLDWMEEHDVAGYVGRSAGQLKVPLLIYSSRCMGGGAITTDCIVKITCIVKIASARNKHVLYEHPKYHRPDLSIREIGAGEMYHSIDLPAAGYTHAVCENGVPCANFKSLKAAQCYVAKMS